jgi:hypothetical protein
MVKSGCACATSLCIPWLGRMPSNLGLRMPPVVTWPWMKKGLKWISQGIHSQRIEVVWHPNWCQPSLKFGTRDNATAWANSAVCTLLIAPVSMSVEKDLSHEFTNTTLHVECYHIIARNAKVKWNSHTYSAPSGLFLVPECVGCTLQPSYRPKQSARHLFQISTSAAKNLLLPSPSHNQTCTPHKPHPI